MPETQHIHVVVNLMVDLVFCDSMYVCGDLNPACHSGPNSRLSLAAVCIEGPNDDNYNALLTFAQTIHR